MDGDRTEHPSPHTWMGTELSIPLPTHTSSVQFEMDTTVITVERVFVCLFVCFCIIVAVVLLFLVVVFVHMSVCVFCGFFFFFFWGGGGQT